MVQVTVSERDCRGVPWRRYVNILGCFIAEGFERHDYEIIRGTKTTVTIDGQRGSEEARTILEMAREMARPKHRHENFG